MKNNDTKTQCTGKQQQRHSNESSTQHTNAHGLTQKAL